MDEASPFLKGEDDPPTSEVLPVCSPHPTWKGGHGSLHLEVIDQYPAAYADSVERIKWWTILTADYDVVLRRR